MSQVIEDKKKDLDLKPNEYRGLIHLYFAADNEYHKFVVAKLPEEIQAVVGRLVNKNYLKYLDNTNSVQITLNGWNTVQNPPGIDRATQNKLIEPEYNAWSVMNGGKPDWGKKRATHIEPSAPIEKKAGSSKTRSIASPTGEKKIDVVRRLMKINPDPVKIFEAMTKEGVQTTFGSVKCFIKTIKDGQK